MRTLKITALCLFALLVIAGHVALWASEAYSAGVKLRLTVLNALGWGVVILPALAVAKWAALPRPRRDQESAAGSSSRHSPGDSSDSA